MVQWGRVQMGEERVDVVVRSYVVFGRGKRELKKVEIRKKSRAPVLMGLPVEECVSR